MDVLSSKLSKLAKRSLPVSTEFNDLIRGVGESKSKSDEDAIVGRMVELCRARMRNGRRDGNSVKELLIYLMYIDMLGHDTSWAQATVIQYCSDKNLVVKKMAYLAVTLLIRPESELAIMVTATIQADLRSDNFLVVCTALSAMCATCSRELVGVYLPTVTALLRHDRDAVKKKALLALQRFLQLDPEVAPEVERSLIDRIGHRDPSVMAASLCGLRELIMGRVGPGGGEGSSTTPYKSLGRYFTNILKQAAEGKLGRGFEYHRAPAPWVQMSLVQLLAALGRGDERASQDAVTVVADVARRAAGLGNAIGNALALECARAACVLEPHPLLREVAEATAASFLASQDNNLRCAGVDVLSRLARARDDPDAVAPHRMALLQCLRVGDATLRAATLRLLLDVARPDNVAVVVEEALRELREGGGARAGRDSQGSLARATARLVARLAPDARWMAGAVAGLLRAGAEELGDADADALARGLVARVRREAGQGEGGEEDEGALLDLGGHGEAGAERGAVQSSEPVSAVDALVAELEGFGGASSFGFRGSPSPPGVDDASSTQAPVASSRSLPDSVPAVVGEVVDLLLAAAQAPGATSLLLRACVWVVGELRGLSARRSAAEAAEELVALASARAADRGVLLAILLALLKLGALAPEACGEARDFARAAARASDASLARVAALALAAGGRDAGSKGALSSPALSVDPALPFLDAFVQRALDAGAAPYLPASLRASLGLGPAVSSGDLPLAQGPLRFQPYAAAAAPRPSEAPAAPRPDPAPQAAAPPAPPAGPQQLLLARGGARRWGAEAAGGPAALEGGPSAGVVAAHRAPAPRAAEDPEAQRLAASLFGGGGGRAGGDAGSAPRPASVLSRTSPARAPPAPATVHDLLGGFGEDGVAGSSDPILRKGGKDVMDLLGGLSVVERAESPGGPFGMPLGGGLDLLSGLGGPSPTRPAAVDLLGGLDSLHASPAKPPGEAVSLLSSPEPDPQRGPRPPRGGDPFADLLG